MKENGCLVIMRSRQKISNFFKQEFLSLKLWSMLHWRWFYWTKKSNPCAKLWQPWVIQPPPPSIWWHPPTSVTFPCAFHSNSYVQDHGQMLQTTPPLFFPATSPSIFLLLFSISFAPSFCLTKILVKRHSNEILLRLCWDIWIEGVSHTYFTTRRHHSLCLFPGSLGAY